MQDDEFIWQAVAIERTSLADLLDNLSEQDWDHASLCAGWRVREVVAHVALTSRVRLGPLLFELIRARGNVARMGNDTALRYAARTSSRQLATEIRDSIGDRFAPVGTTATDRLMDLLVHGQDIARPLGLDREMPTEAARIALDRVWTMGWPFHAAKNLTGCRLIATDAPWSAGDGLTVEGPIAALLLLATGRTVELPALAGPGVQRLIAHSGR